jgi:hypothetical protein
LGSPQEDWIASARSKSGGARTFGNTVQTADLDGR